MLMISTAGAQWWTPVHTQEKDTDEQHLPTLRSGTRRPYWGSSYIPEQAKTDVRYPPSLLWYNAPHHARHRRATA